MVSEEADPEDLTDSSRILLLADVRDSLAAVNGAEADLIHEVLELRGILSLLTGVPSRLDRAGLPVEATSIREHDLLLSTQLTESEDRLEVVRAMKRRLLTAEERLDADPESPRYGLAAAHSVNGSHDDRDRDGNVVDERRALFRRPG